jgi:two-component system, NtrC family, sensor kinase
MIWTPKGAKLMERCDPATFRRDALRFAVERKSIGDPHILFTVIEVAGRPAAVLAFVRPGRRFGRHDAHFASDAAEILGKHLEERERTRAGAVQERIVGKVLLQLRPADILYQVLHGLRRVLRYDHGASVQTLDKEAKALIVRAETIAWTKGKSPRIGRPIHLDEEAIRWCEGLESSLFVDPIAPEPLLAGAVIRDLATVSPDAPTPRSMIIAPLSRDRAVIGLLVVRALAPGAFVSADLERINSFLPILSASAFHAEVFRQQQDKLHEAERRTALGNVARAISHDLSNAFGVIQPLLEKLHHDVAEGTITPENLSRDIAMLHQYVGISLRIFQGLLSFARGSTDGIARIDISVALDTVIGLLSRGLTGQGIEVVKEIPAALPAVEARRQDLEQIFLNLITNARESMPTGGKITIRASVEEGKKSAGPGPATGGGSSIVHITIADTGCGIPERLLDRVFEPFFTTKRGGTGLGLDICRSIIWEYDGALWLESEEGKGSTAHVRIPVRPETQPPDARPSEPEPRTSHDAKEES